MVFIVKTRTMEAYNGILIGPPKRSLLFMRNEWYNKLHRCTITIIFKLTFLTSWLQLVIENELRLHMTNDLWWWMLVVSLTKYKYCRILCTWSKPGIHKLVQFSHACHLICSFPLHFMFNRTVILFFLKLGQNCQTRPSYKVHNIQNWTVRF